MADFIQNAGWLPPKEPLAKATYTKVTSIVILTFRHEVTVVGNLDVHNLAYKAAQAHCAAFGWWGIPFGLLFTPAALMKNVESFNQVKVQLGGQKSGAGWYRDPSGKFHERLWDGAVWTELVRNTMAESMIDAIIENRSLASTDEKGSDEIKRSNTPARKSLHGYLDNFRCPHCEDDVYLDLAARRDDFLWECPSCQVKSGKSKWLSNRLK